MSEFEDYIRNRFEGVSKITDDDAMPMDFWYSAVEQSKTHENGAAGVINARICKAIPVEFRAPEKVSIEVFDSFAGEIPVISAGDPGDFEDLVTNLVHKGVRSENISKTGASFIYGKSVRFIILSSKPYSNVTAGEVGLDEETWAEKSMLIRRSHECTHYYTKRNYGITCNILHDELMADFIGLYDAFGFYKSEWFLRFLGIIEGSGKRLDVYTEGLSPETADAVKSIAVKASGALEKWSLTGDFERMTNAERIDEMCRAGLAGIAGWEDRL